ncbi:MAG: SCO family protein [Candidatus Omnitrophica bacterium]|nr:SCO family protein [Candidatus Omnitrophota bacterium]
MRWKQFYGKFFLVSFFVFIPCLLFACEELPHYGQVPDFVFQEQNGNAFGFRDLEGNVWIADFIFTRCQGMCPMLTGKMALLQEALEDPNVKLVSFSVDPKHDTPKVLKDYALRHGAQEGKWFFLTGDETAMRNFIIDGFSLGVAQATPEDLAQGAEPVMHSNRFVLVDPEGKIRGYYDSSDSQKMEQLIQDALKLQIPSNKSQTNYNSE